MRKIIVIGCPGSGKSTFSRALSSATGIPLFHLDRIYWNEDKTTVEKSVFLQRLSHILRQDRWIVDGNYASTMELRLQQCDTVIFLDYPVDVCLSGIQERQGKPRRDIPWIDTEDDPEFIRFIQNFQSQSRPEIMQLLNQYAHKNIYIFTSRTEADSFLAQRKF